MGSCRSGSFAPLSLACLPGWSRLALQRSPSPFLCGFLLVLLVSLRSFRKPSWLSESLICSGRPVVLLASVLPLACLFPTGSPCGLLQFCHGNICGAFLLNGARALVVYNTTFLIDSRVCCQKHNCMFLTGHEGAQRSPLSRPFLRIAGPRRFQRKAQPPLLRSHFFLCSVAPGLTRHQLVNGIGVLTDKWGDFYFGHA